MRFSSFCSLPMEGSQSDLLVDWNFPGAGTSLEDCLQDCPKGSTLYGFKGGPAGIHRAGIGIYLSLQKSVYTPFFIEYNSMPEQFRWTVVLSKRELLNQIVCEVVWDSLGHTPLQVCYTLTHSA
ncbi:hypothetical protein HHK36_013183 [Tetracentron sinense]|uniref:Uncharacterized protein n=1 Tax=Tetracentron sinense TaxID=13715 RepID=A0A834ZE65_TETSI|nr:hypothetical protein HHK36_013183 [Tetracentron sinense]